MSLHFINAIFLLLTNDLLSGWSLLVSTDEEMEAFQTWSFAQDDVAQQAFTLRVQNPFS